MTVIAWLSSVLGTVQGILVRVSVILTSFYLFVYDCAGCSLLHACGLCSSCGKQRLLFSYGVQASRCAGFPCGALALGRMGFSSCGTWAQWLWHLELVAP